MYICNCKGVTERQIHDAIAQGHCTRRAISACLQAGTCCGKCNSEIRDLLSRHGTNERMTVGAFGDAAPGLVAVAA